VVYVMEKAGGGRREAGGGGKEIGQGKRPETTEGS